jgi:hypothetical protein
MNETILKNIESMSENPEELREYLIELKNRGILTQGEVNEIMSEVSSEGKGKLGQRTPDTMEYAYSNVSAGFGSTGILGLLALSAPAIVAMINLLNK